MLAVFVDVLQRRLRSAHRTIVILSLPPPSLFTFIAQTRARDVRIITSDFFDDDWGSYMQQSGWNYVSMGDGARLCADAMRDAAALRKSLKESEGGVS